MPLMAALTAPQRKEIDEVLADFGLKDKERCTYVALLPLGRVPLMPAARAAGLKPTTAQSVLARLAEKGLVTLTARGARHTFEAAEPAALRRLLERRQEEVASIIPLLKSLRAEPPSAAKVQVHYRDRMIEPFHLALAAKSKQVLEIVAARDLQQILGERFHFTRRRVKAGVRLRSLRVESREIKKYSAATHARELREAKFLPRELSFRSSIMCWDDTVAFFTTKDEGVVVTMTSPSTADAVRQLFDLLWSVSRKMETA